MGFLVEIVRETVAAVRSPEYLSGLPSERLTARPSLRKALDRDRSRGGLLVEYKRVSPGQADPRLPARSIREFVDVTRSADVTGYSCLAARPRFEGSPRDVAALAAATSAPVLFKDFLVDPVQVEAARRAGASAILLIARLGTEGRIPRPLPELAELAHVAGLEVLLEFHDRAELSVVGQVAADMYGVNVRDLDTLALDRSTAARTIAAARSLGLHPLLGLSGVEGPREADAFWQAGVDGILVGSGLARARAPVQFLASLARRSREEGPA